MSTCIQAFDWLNLFSPTAVPPQLYTAAQQLNNITLSSAHLQSEADDLIQQCSGNPAAQAEIGAIAGRAFFLRQGTESEALQLAEKYWQAAAQIYASLPGGSGLHQQAVLLWLLGCVRRRMPLKRSLAQANSQKALEIFKKLWQNNAQMSMVAGWYSDRLVEMHIQTASVIEEAANWLTVFGGSQLKPPANLLAAQMKKHVENGNIPAIVQLASMAAQQMEGMEYTQRTELAMTTGLVLFEIGQYAHGVRSLQLALKASERESHHRAVLQWIYGLMLYEQGGEHRVESLKALSQAIVHFSEREKQALHTGHVVESAWYRARIHEMEAELKRLAQACYP